MQTCPNLYLPSCREVREGLHQKVLNTNGLNGLNLVFLHLHKCLHQKCLYRERLHRKVLHRSCRSCFNLSCKSLHRKSLHRECLHKCLHRNCLHRERLHRKDLHRSCRSCLNIPRKSLHRECLHRKASHLNGLNRHRKCLHRKRLHQECLHQRVLHRKALKCSHSQGPYRASSDKDCLQLDRLHPICEWSNRMNRHQAMVLRQSDITASSLNLPTRPKTVSTQNIHDTRQFISLHPINSHRRAKIRNEIAS